MQQLVVETREAAPVEDLLEFTDPAAPLAWLRRSDGFVGAGPVVWRLDARGIGGESSRSRLESLAEAWSQLVGAASVVDDVRLPGTGLVAFGAFAFDEGSVMPSSLIVPSVIVGRHAGRAWITRIWVAGDEAPADPQRMPYGPYWAGTLGPGTLGPEGYQAAVREGLAAIAAGEVGKVVLARELVGSIPAAADLRRLARALSSGYPDTWTYAVDGIIGASPETLVTVASGTVTARVLAGTTPRGADADSDVAASFALATSAKDLDEHEYAVQSVLAALRPHTNALAASEQPFTLKLPNVWHLATDIEGDLADGSTALDLVRALHPTAAVAGTPTEAAIAAIRRIEPFDRGRYAGPVGWIGAHGDGEWAIALRCAQFPGPMPRRSAEYIEGQRVVAHAGAGIVAGSDPESELVETRVKFRPIVDALA